MAAFDHTQTRMRSSLLLFPLVGLVIGLGCNKPYKEEREAWGPAEWKESLRENEQRFKSEDERKKPIYSPLGKAQGAIGDQIARIYNWIMGNTPFDAAKGLLDPYYPDRRRQGIMWLSKHDYGRKEPYTRYYAEMGRTDEDYTVRSMAVRALNRARVRQDSSLYIAALEDKSEMVRLEAAKALANMPDPAAVPGLLKHLGDVEENVDVRVACADALRNYRTSEVAQALIRSLRDRDFAVVWQARWSLKLMTGRDYRYDPAAWLSYVSGSEKPFG